MPSLHSSAAFLGILLLAGAVGMPRASAQRVIAGIDPVTDLGGPDGWANVLYINESHPFDFTGTGQIQGVAFQFSFWADTSTGIVTPFVAEVVEANVFIVRAIGTPRRGGEDWMEPGLQTFAFKDGEAPLVQQGWAAGFLSATPEGAEGGSPIPFVGSDVEGWLTGSAASDSGAPALVEGEAPVLGLSGTDDAAYGQRRYAFHVAAALTTPQPPTDITATPSVLRAGLAAGATVATLSAVDGNAVDTHTFELVAGEGSADNGRFTVDGASLKAAAALGGDGTGYSIRVRARDGAGLTVEKILTLEVRGNQPPTAVQLTPSTLFSLQPAGSAVGLLTTEDPNLDQGDSHVYELVSGDGSEDNLSFRLEENRLIVEVDLESGRTYRIRVRSTDSTGLSREQSMHLPVITTLGNLLGSRTDAATDTATVPIFYTNGVAMPGPGRVDAVTLPLQSAAQLELEFHLFLMRPLPDGETFQVVADTGAITVTGSTGGLATFPFPNGPILVQAGDLFYHYGRGIPFDAGQGNALPIWYPCPIPPIVDEPLSLAFGNPDFPLRDDLIRDYAWAVHYAAGGPAASFAITAMTLDPALGQVTLTWQSQPGRTYRIKASATLGLWPTVIETSIPAAAGSATTSRTFGPVTLPGPTFYRVEENP